MILEFSMQNTVYCTTIKAATTACSNKLEETKEILRQFLLISLSTELYLIMLSEYADISDIGLFAFD